MTMAAQQARLDVELVRRGIARSRQRAAELVVEGRVRVNGEVMNKPSCPVLADAQLDVEEAAGAQFVSRGARKLDGALAALTLLTAEPPRIAGALCLDAGASTGGFTQVLLERGAAHVLAVDVGRGQMDSLIAHDPRVTAWEATNIRDLTPADLPGRPALVVADLSFISLTVVAGVLIGLTAPGGHLLLMVKPQFEVGRGRLGSRGVVTSPALRQEAVLGVARSALENGAHVRAVVPSPLAGPSGNQEYFLWLVAPAEQTDARSGTRPQADLVDAVRRAVVEGSATLVGPPRHAPTGTSDRETGPSVRSQGSRS